MIICTVTPGEKAPDGFTGHDLRKYIEHKIGQTIEEIRADSPERFLVIEAEALRDLAVMSEVTGQDAFIVLLPDTPANPECKRLLDRYCRAEG